MVSHLEKTLSSRQYIAGERFTAADTQIGSSIHYAVSMLKVLPGKPVFPNYLSRLASRSAFETSMAKDLEMAMACGSAGAA